MKKILVLGSGGQLGRTLIDISEYERIPMYGLDHNTCDITNETQLKHYLYDLQPDIVINCAAWTNVNLAERLDCKQKVYDINVTGSGNIAKYCKEIGAKLIHISTDYIFGDGYNRPIRESELPYPINWYGETKWRGELAVDRNHDNWIIIRTSWVYSKYNMNFVNKVYDSLLGCNTCQVCIDEISSPTYGVDLAKFILTICNDKYNDVQGVFNFSNIGPCSRYDLAYKIAELCNMRGMIVPVYKSVSAVPRPKYSVLDLGKTSLKFSFKLRDWREALEDYHKNRFLK